MQSVTFCQKTSRTLRKATKMNTIWVSHQSGHAPCRAENFVQRGGTLGLKHPLTVENSHAPCRAEMGHLCFPSGLAFQQSCCNFGFADQSCFRCRFGFANAWAAGFGFCYGTTKRTSEELERKISLHRPPSSWTLDKICRRKLYCQVFGSQGCDYEKHENGEWEDQWKTRRQNLQIGEKICKSIAQAHETPDEEAPCERLLHQNVFKRELSLLDLVQLQARRKQENQIFGQTLSQSDKAIEKPK